MISSQSFADFASRGDYEKFILHLERFDALEVVEVPASEFNSDFIRKRGLQPFLIDYSLGNHILLEKFDTVRNCLDFIVSEIGENFVVQVIDVAKQTDEPMSLKTFKDRFNETSESRKIYNLISLEVSNSPIATRILGPKCIREIDWIDQMWPLSLRSINDYPRVQRYCLVSMAGSFTDFHIDFGGTSVWYHVFHGRKRFFMIPPTRSNLEMYESWLGSKRQKSQFFGQMVEKCFEIELEEGQTMIIPSGWIHAVYTPVDSLVFGGNFLHSFSIVKQLQVYCIEHRSNVENIYRFPHFKQLSAYVLTELYSVAWTSISGKRPSAAFMKKYPTHYRIHWHFQCLLDLKILPQIVCLIKTVEIWVENRLFELSSFQKSTADLGLTPDTLISRWWTIVNKLSKDLESSTGTKGVSAYVQRIQNSRVFNIFNEETVNFDEEFAERFDASASANHDPEDPFDAPGVSISKRKRKAAPMSSSMDIDSPDAEDLDKDEDDDEDVDFAPPPDDDDDDVMIEFAPVHKKLASQRRKSSNKRQEENDFDDDDDFVQKIRPPVKKHAESIVLPSTKKAKVIPSRQQLLKKLK